MKKRRMKADGVDQLFEIVKAVQMGQDPEEMLKKKQAESAPLADSPKSNPGIGALDDEDDEWESAGIGAKLKAAREARRLSAEEKDVQARGLSVEEEDVQVRRVLKGKLSQSEDTRDSGDMKRITAEDGWDEDDDFEQLLNDDAEQSADAGAFAEKLGAVLQAAAGFFARPKKSEQKKESGDEMGSDAAEQSDSAEKKKEKREKKKSAGKSAKKMRKTAEKAVQDEQPENPDEELVPGGANAVSEAAGQDKVKAEAAGPEQDDVPELAEADMQKPAGSEEAGHAPSQDSPITEESDGELIEIDVNDENLTDEELQARMEDGKTLDRILDIPCTAAQQDAAQMRIPADDAERTEDTGTADAAEAEDGSEEAVKSEPTVKKSASSRRISGSLSQSEQESEKASSAKKKSAKKDSPVSVMIDRIQDTVFGLMDRLHEKEIHRKEMIMIAVGAVLILLMLVLGVNYVKVLLVDQKKSEHVTADSGLKITVEKEPQEWCRSYPVSMKVRVKGGTASRVTIDGAIYEPDENGMITVRARDALMNAVVEAESGTLNAQIEFPKIDAQAPAVSAARELDLITLTAADGRSGIGKVWYAAVKNSDYLEIPSYKEYTEPFMYEPETMYYFYAEDLAGNRSIPVKTTMEEASALVLGSSELNLFPGESVYLSVDGDPSGALLNNLSFESMNQDVVSVSSSGLITALGEGATAVKVKADGLAEVMCTVEVSRTRTVTIGAIGDCTLGSDAYFNTNVNFQAFETMNGTSYFFKNVKDILENDDATFANLECVFTDSSARENKQYAFRGAPYYTEILQEGSVEVVTLANNHSSDYGEQSQKDTKQYLTNAGIDYCIGDTIAVQEIKGIKTAFIGIYVLRDGLEREEQVRQTIAEAKALGAQLIVVGFHWGSEKATQPDQIQTTLAHLAIDEGADLVVGHHPHVLQGIEKYNGKYIVYSLGNFCFGGNTNPSDTDTIIFRQTFTISEGAVLQDDQIEVVPCSISGTSSYNDYQPVPAAGAEADRIMDRLNEYSAQFEQRFTASSGLGQ